MPPGSVRSTVSEKTPCVFSPMRTAPPGRSMRAWVNVSPALNVVAAVSTATGPP